MDTLRTLGGEHSNERGIRPGDPLCEHDKPMLVERAEGGNATPAVCAAKL
jgi:hypothetical protein